MESGVAAAQETWQSDESAFDALAARYRAGVRAFCGRFLRDSEDAEDAVQEIWLRVWRSRHSFRGDSTFATWLYRIAEHACLDILEKRKRIPRQSLEDAETPLSEPISPEPSPEQLTVWQLMREAVLQRGATSGWKLTDFRLYYFHCERGLSFRETAERMAQSEDALKKRYLRNVEPTLRQVEREFEE